MIIGGTRNSAGFPIFYGRDLSAWGAFRITWKRFISGGSRLRLRNENVLEAIHKAVDIEAVWRRPKEYAIVMGVDDYMTMMSQDRNNMPPVGFSFTAGPFGYRDSRFGLPVHVVTSLSGIAAIPRVIIEREQTRAT